MTGPPASEFFHASDDGTFIALTSLTWDEALVSYSLPGASSLTIEAAAPEKVRLGETAGKDSSGRIQLTGLRPNTEYEVAAHWSEGSAPLRFRTLRPPSGPPIASFAAVADTHVSLSDANRKGRLFVESRTILRELVDEWNALALDFVFIAGDVTESGKPDEYAEAGNILGRLSCPCLPVPGDHDIRGGDAAWRSTFGERSRFTRIGGIGVFGLDTSDGLLGPDARCVLQGHWHDRLDMRLIVSHHQLFPDDYIVSMKKKTVHNFEDEKGFVADLFRNPALVYAGHQNVPSQARSRRALQLNLPQTGQFPCGYVLVRQYANGFYHTFRPIKSEALNARSREESHAAAARHAEPQWRREYRIGRDPYQANFVYRP